VRAATLDRRSATLVEIDSTDDEATAEGEAVVMFRGLRVPISAEADMLPLEMVRVAPRTPKK
jgi:hypothetical protein